MFSNFYNELLVKENIPIMIRKTGIRFLSLTVVSKMVFGSLLDFGS